MADPGNQWNLNKYLRCNICGNTVKEPIVPIKLQDWITSSGSYPERAKSKELTDEVKANAEELLKRVNALLEELGIEKTKLSSGFRPSDVNKAVGGAKKSNHQSGKALDIIDDKNQSICKKITKELLEKHNLYREDSTATKGKYSNWCHLQSEPTKSGKRIFMP